MRPLLLTAGDGLTGPNGIRGVRKGSCSMTTRDTRLFSFLALIGIFSLIGGAGYFIYRYAIEYMKDYSDLMEYLNFLVLLFIAVGGWRQFKTVHKQSELDRIVSWKSSLQEVNKLIFAHPDKFTSIFYPDMSEEDLLKITGAYTSLNAMETIYHMRKDKNDPEKMKRIRAYLKSYLSNNPAIKDMWAIKEYHDAFTQEFQDEVNQILK